MTKEQDSRRHLGQLSPYFIYIYFTLEGGRVPQGPLDCAVFHLHLSHTSGWPCSPGTARLCCISPTFISHFRVAVFPRDRLTVLYFTYIYLTLQGGRAPQGPLDCAVFHLHLSHTSGWPCSPGTARLCCISPTFISHFRVAVFPRDRSTVPYFTYTYLTLQGGHVPQGPLDCAVFHLHLSHTSGWPCSPGTARLCCISPTLISHFRVAVLPRDHSTVPYFTYTYLTLQGGRVPQGPLDCAVFHLHLSHTSGWPCSPGTARLCCISPTFISYFRVAVFPRDRSTVLYFTYTEPQDTGVYTCADGTKRSKIDIVLNGNFLKARLR